MEVLGCGAWGVFTFMYPDCRLGSSNICQREAHLVFQLEVLEPLSPVTSNSFARRLYKGCRVVLEFMA